MRNPTLTWQLVSQDGSILDTEVVLPPGDVTDDANLAYVMRVKVIRENELRLPHTGTQALTVLHPASARYTCLCPGGRKVRVAASFLPTVEEV